MIDSIILNFTIHVNELFVLTNVLNGETVD